MNDFLDYGVLNGWRKLLEENSDNKRGMMLDSDS